MTQSYLELRDRTRARDRSLYEKVMTLEEAAGLVADGDHVALADFDRRKDQRFWRGLRGLLPVWDELIERFNRETGLGGRAGRAA